MVLSIIFLTASTMMRIFHDGFRILLFVLSGSQRHVEPADGGTTSRLYECVVARSPSKKRFHRCCTDIKGVHQQFGASFPDSLQTCMVKFVSDIGNNLLLKIKSGLRTIVEKRIFVL